MVMKERDEELTLFLEMRRREKEKNSLLVNNNDLDSSLGVCVGGGGSPMSKLVSGQVPQRKATATENFLNSVNDKSDYDWLLTPPGTPVFPSLETESHKAKVCHLGSNVRPTALKPRLENLMEEPTSRSVKSPKNPTLSNGLNTSSISNRRPSSSSARAATPTGRSTLTTTAKPSRPSTPTSRPTLPSSKATAPTARSSAPTARSSTPSRSTARSSTPTARPTVTAPKPVPRSATPNSRHTVIAPKPVPRSSTPTSRSTPRSATPTRRASAPSSTPTTSAPPSRSSSVSKPVPATSKNPVPSRGTSPVKSRPWKPSEMPGFSLEAPPNLKTTLSDRPSSASRSRPGATNSQSSIDAGSNIRRRQQSCSPSRVRTSSGNARGSSIPAARKVNTSSDYVNPVQMGTQMVERVVNMRKLAPPKQDHDSSGFGRTLSKKSLDMALRHMDIRRSVPGNLRPLMTNIPASSMYSVRTGSTKSRTLSVSDSPLATSSNAGSEPSVNNSFCLDDSEIESHFGSERGNTSPSSHRGR